MNPKRILIPERENVACGKVNESVTATSQQQIGESNCQPTAYWTKVSGEQVKGYRYSAGRILAYIGKLNAN